MGLALIALGGFFLRKKKANKATAPQTGGAAMAQTDPSVPPAGVGGYTDAKPQFGAQQQPYGQADPYANQGAYASQQGYPQAPTSPAPQYAAPTQYNAPGSPPPQQAYQQDVKYGYAGVPAGEAAELGGNSSGIAPAGAPTAPSGTGVPASQQVQAAELGGGESTQQHHLGHQQQGQYPGGAELPGNTSTNH